MSNIIPSTTNESFIATFVSVCCKYISPEDIIKCILLFSNGNEGIAGIIDISHASNNGLIAAEAVVKRQVKLACTLDVEQFFSNANPLPTKHDFCIFMKQRHNLKHGLSVKVYRIEYPYFARKHESPEGQTININYNEHKCDARCYTMTKCNSGGGGDETRETKYEQEEDDHEDDHDHDNDENIEKKMIPFRQYNKSYKMSESASKLKLLNPIDEHHALVSLGNISKLAQISANRTITRNNREYEFKYNPVVLDRAQHSTQCDKYNNYSIDKFDLFLFKNIFNGNKDEMMYYWLNVKLD